MNHRELDRRLCERLGIPADLPSRHIMHDYAGRPQMCDCGARSFEDRIADEPCIAHPAVYPPLSTTGDGMVRLLDELRYQNHEVVIEYLLEGLCYVRVGSANWKGCLPAPLSLALAAAAALQIEVPE